MKPWSREDVPEEDPGQNRGITIGGGGAGGVGGVCRGGAAGSQGDRWGMARSGGEDDTDAFEKSGELTMEMRPLDLQ